MVAENLTQECLLGADFLTTQGCIVDLQRRVMITHGEEIPPQDARKKETMACHVAISDTTTIPARYQVWLEAQLATPGKEMHECIGMVEPEPKFIHRHGLYVAHSLSINRNGFIVVQVLNPTLAPIVVHKSEKLGLFQPVQSESQVHSIETKTSLATQQEPPSTKAAEIITEMKCSVEGLTESEQRKFGELLTKYAEIIPREMETLEEPTKSDIRSTHKMLPLSSSLQEGSHYSNMRKFGR
jgi:hypothetical protein